MSELSEHRSGDALILTLNRPEARNALSPEMKNKLIASLEREATHPSCRAVLLRGSGGAFCSGADMRPSTLLTRRATIETEIKEGVNRVVSLIAEIAVPVVAAIQGPAAGAGVGIALAADILLVAPSAKLHVGFTNIGAVPDAGVTAALTTKLGAARAGYLTLLGETVDAEQALLWGLAARRLSEDTFDADTDHFAAQLAQRATKALGLTKRLLASASQHTHMPAEHLDLEAQLQAQAFASRDFEEGVHAFAEKRPPRFVGR